VPEITLVRLSDIQLAASILDVAAHLDGGDLLDLIRKGSVIADDEIADEEGEAGNGSETV
jgi:hypothetical protein